MRNQPIGNDEGLGEGWLVPAVSVQGVFGPDRMVNSFNLSLYLFSQYRLSSGVALKYSASESEHKYPRFVSQTVLIKVPGTMVLTKVEAFEHGKPLRIRTREMCLCNKD
jgi:hypothetical protein